VDFSQQDKRDSTPKHHAHEASIHESTPISYLDLHDCILMAETLDGTLPPLREEEPHSHPHQDPGPTGPTDPTPAGSDARESIALARVRGQYSRASSYHRPGSSTTSGKPTTLLERLTYPISKFWRRQISITVAHESCRDHLGMSMPLCSLAVDIFQINHYVENFLFWPPEDAFRRNPVMQNVIWYFYTNVSQNHLQNRQLHLSSFTVVRRMRQLPLIFLIFSISLRSLTDRPG